MLAEDLTRALVAASPDGIVNHMGGQGVAAAIRLSALAGGGIGGLPNGGGRPFINLCLRVLSRIALSP